MSCTVLLACLVLPTAHASPGIVRNVKLSNPYQSHQLRFILSKHKWLIWEADYSHCGKSRPADCPASAVGVGAYSWKGLKLGPGKSLYAWRVSTGVSIHFNKLLFFLNARFAGSSRPYMNVFGYYAKNRHFAVLSRFHRCYRLRSDRTCAR